MSAALTLVAVLSILGRLNDLRLSLFLCRLGVSVNQAFLCFLEFLFTPTLDVCAFALLKYSAFTFLFAAIAPFALLIWLLDLFWWLVHYGDGLMWLSAECGGFALLACAIRFLSVCPVF
ncbi:MAG: hypothetical protein K0U66_03105 [Gammaproteobacteria bacterium]|nr:hypothetical protein [Gammaproteobacteria bacterium]